MGGYGSGRQGGRCTIEATDSYVLSAKSIKQIPHGTPCRAKGSWTWKDGFKVDYTLDATHPNFPKLTFTHHTREGGDWSDEPLSYELYLTSTATRFRGRRWWFQCPNLGRRAFKLYLPNGGRRFLCREAYRLGYACQRETYVDRLMRKARKLHRVLGGDGQAIGDEWAPPKPKWMRWKTYYRKITDWENADARADAAWGLSAIRLIAKCAR